MVKIELNVIPKGSRILLISDVAFGQPYPNSVSGLNSGGISYYKKGVVWV